MGCLTIDGVKIFFIIIGLSILLAGVSLAVQFDRCMCGGNSWVSFSYADDQMRSWGDAGIVGWNIPIEKDPGTNPTSLRMVDVQGVFLNMSIYVMVSSVAVGLYRFRKVPEQNTITSEDGDDIPMMEVFAPTKGVIFFAACLLSPMAACNPLKGLTP